MQRSALMRRLENVLNPRIISGRPWRISSCRGGFSTRPTTDPAHWTELHAAHRPAGMGFVKIALVD